MHIFLTGEIQVGKSTIIRNFLAQSGLSADGFMTYWETDRGGGRNLYLSPYSLAPQIHDRRLIVHDNGGHRHHRLSLTAGAVEAFDIYGAAILNDSGKRSAVIMDELGVMESKSPAFQRAVMRHIYGNVTVLGVIKPVNNEFLNTIRSHENVAVHEVTPENRDSVLKWLMRVPAHNWQAAGRY